MRNGHRFASPGTRYVSSLLLVLIAALSAGLISLCSLAWYSYSGVTDKPVEAQIQEQLSLPAYMPYDVWVFEPSGAAVATITLYVMLALSGLFVLWNTWNTILAMKANSVEATNSYSPARYRRRAAGALVLFWVLSCILLGILMQVIAASSHGIPPYGFDAHAAIFI